MTFFIPFSWLVVCIIVILSPFNSILEAYVLLASFNSITIYTHYNSYITNTELSIVNKVYTIINFIFALLCIMIVNSVLFNSKVNQAVMMYIFFLNLIQYIVYGTIYFISLMICNNSTMNSDENGERDEVDILNDLDLESGDYFSKLGTELKDLRCVKDLKDLKDLKDIDGKISIVICKADNTAKVYKKNNMGCNTGSVCETIVEDGYEYDPQPEQNDGFEMVNPLMF